MQFFSQELIQLIGNQEDLEILFVILEIAKFDNKLEFSIRREEYLHVDNDIDDYTVLNTLMNRLLNLEFCGVLQFAIDYDKTIYIKLNKEILKHIIDVPSDISEDMSLFNKELNEKKAYGDDNKHNNIIPFPLSILGGGNAK